MCDVCSVRCAVCSVMWGWQSARLEANHRHWSALQDLGQGGPWPWWRGGAGWRWEIDHDTTLVWNHHIQNCIVIKPHENSIVDHRARFLQLVTITFSSGSVCRDGTTCCRRIFMPMNNFFQMIFMWKASFRLIVFILILKLIWPCHFRKCFKPNRN